MKKNRFMKKMLGLQHRHDEIMRLLGEIQPNGKVLDLGSREGIITKRMKDAGYEVTAADAVIAVPEHYKIPRVRADFNDPLPFADKSFDIATCFNTLEELENPFFFLRQCCRVLNPGGHLVLSTPNVLNLQSRVAGCLTGFYRFNGRPPNEVSSGKWGGQRINFIDYFKLRYILHRNGFKIIEATTQEFSNKAMAFALLYPFAALFTKLAMRFERDPRQRQRNSEIFRHVISPDLLFGKHLLIVAEKFRESESGE